MEKQFPISNSKGFRGFESHFHRHLKVKPYFAQRGAVFLLNIGRPGSNAVYPSLRSRSAIWLRLFEKRYRAVAVNALAAERLRRMQGITLHPTLYHTPLIYGPEHAREKWRGSIVNTKAPCHG